MFRFISIWNHFFLELPPNWQISYSSRSNAKSCAPGLCGCILRDLFENVAHHDFTFITGIITRPHKILPWNLLGWWASYILFHGVNHKVTVKFLPKTTAARRPFSWQQGSTFFKGRGLKCYQLRTALCSGWGLFFSPATIALAVLTAIKQMSTWWNLLFCCSQWSQPLPHRLRLSDALVQLFH